MLGAQCHGAIHGCGGVGVPHGNTRRRHRGTGNRPLGAIASRYCEGEEGSDARVKTPIAGIGDKPHATLVRKGIRTHPRVREHELNGTPRNNGANGHRYCQPGNNADKSHRKRSMPFIRNATCAEHYRASRLIDVGRGHLEEARAPRMHGSAQVALYQIPVPIGAGEIDADHEVVVVMVATAKRGFPTHDVEAVVPLVHDMLSTGGGFVGRGEGPVGVARRLVRVWAIRSPALTFRIAVCR